MKRFYSVVVLFATLVFLPGCLEVKNEFVINPNGSGKVRHHVLFSPMQMKLGGKQLSGQEQLRQAVKKEISKSKGVDAWKDVSYKVKDNGTLSFTGTAYFSDISELDFYSQGLKGPIKKISRSEKSNGTITFEMTPGDKQTTRSSNNTGPELTEEQVQKKIEKQRQQFQKMKPMLSQLEEIQISNIFNLPAPVQSSTNVELDSPKRAGVFVSGKQLVNAMDAMISSDEIMRERVKQGKGLKEPPSNLETHNEKIFGEKGPVKFTISGGGSPQFDYEQEVRQAKKETKKLKSKLGIESSVSNAGETSGTSGSGSLPDGDGGKYGVALKNKETMKANWGIAFLNREDNELILGFYPKTPKKNLIKSIREKRSLFRVFDLEEPLIEITLRLKEGTPLSGDAVSRYSFVFSNFSGGPMTISRSGTSMMEEVQLKLDGSLEKGGRIKGVFKGSQDYDFQDHDDTYTWDLKFDLPIR